MPVVRFIRRASHPHSGGRYVATATIALFLLGTLGCAALPPTEDAAPTTLRRGRSESAPGTKRVTPIPRVAPASTTTTSTTTTTNPVTPIPRVAPATTTTTSTTTTTTTSVPSPGTGDAPTAASTGPRVGNPAHVGRVEVYNGQSVTLTDVVADGIVVYGGGQVTVTNVRITGSVVVLPMTGAATTKVHITDSAIHAGMTVNVVDSGGSLYWGGETPVDLIVSGSWIHHPQGDGSYHTEALAGFGWPRGARFTGSTIVQDGPFNGTATATVNWHGADTVFDGDHFTWGSGTAAYFTVYVEGRNNVVKSSTLEVGLADYVYPSSSPMATYTYNVDATTGESIAP